MKRVLIGAAVFLGVVTAIRKFGPWLGQRAMAECEAMMDHMPDDFPPKRMMRSIEEIRLQNVKIVEHLAAESDRPTLVATG